MAQVDIEALSQRYLERYCGEQPVTEAHAEEDTALAEQALADQDLERGQFPLACALLMNPSLPERRALLQRYVESAAELFPSEAQPWFAFQALRAYRLHHDGKLEQALDSLEDIVQNVPQTLYLESWALDWLDDDAALKELGLERVARTIARMVHDRYPDHENMTEVARQELERGLQVLLRVERVLGLDRGLSMMKMVMLGKVGRFDEAVTLARQAYEDDPNWHSAIAAAGASRRSGDWQGAVAFFRKAVEHDPDDKSARLDIGDLHLDRDLWQEAIDAYQEVLDRQEDHPWAHPSLLYGRYRRDDDEAALEELRTLAHTDHGEDCTCGGHDAMMSIMQQLTGYSPETAQQRAEELLTRLA